MGLERCIVHSIVSKPQLFYLSFMDIKTPKGAKLFMMTARFSNVISAPSLEHN